VTADRFEAQFSTLRYVDRDGTDHASHAEQASMIRRHIAWWHRHATNPRVRNPHASPDHQAGEGCLLRH
jgi:hypothetical protein